MLDQLYGKLQKFRSTNLPTIIHLPRGKKVKQIHQTYSDVNESEVVVLFNSSDLLEVAINRADKNAISGASTLLGIKEGDQIIINFLNKDQ